MLGLIYHSNTGVRPDLPLQHTGVRPDLTTPAHRCYALSTTLAQVLGLIYHSSTQVLGLIYHSDKRRSLTESGCRKTAVVYNRVAVSQSVQDSVSSFTTLQASLSGTFLKTARIDYTTKRALFISTHQFTITVSTLYMVRVLKTVDAA